MISSTTLNAQVPVWLTQSATVAVTSKTNSSQTTGSRRSTHARAISALSNAAATNAASPALQSAIGKLEQSALILGASESLDDAMGQLMLLQSKQTSQRATLAKGSIEGKFKRLEAQTKREIQEINKRIESLQSSSFWDTLIKVFQGIASGVSLVAGAMSGNPLLVTGAALTLSSMIVGCASKSEEAFWVSAGLALGGACFSIGASFCNPTGWTPLVKDSTINTISTLGSGVASGTASAFFIPKALEDGNVLDADAALMQIRATAKQLIKDADQEREAIRLVCEAETQGMSLVMKTLNNNHRVARAAVRG